jgi:hypothetical protein
VLNIQILIPAVFILFQQYGHGIKIGCFPENYFAQGVRVPK